ncbi:MAG: DUF2007 domain-containing protein [Deltaproteobacteria bacterium]|nr:DUF2007 domain-containing protein [Deltaproteobacteria bacterium]
MATRIRFIDLYSIFDEVDANIIENLLGDYDIDCTIKELAAETGGEEGTGATEKMIAVEEDKIEDARRIIADAIHNGVISEEGQFMV